MKKSKLRKSRVNFMKDWPTLPCLCNLRRWDHFLLSLQWLILRLSWCRDYKQRKRCEPLVSTRRRFSSERQWNPAEDSPFAWLIGLIQAPISNSSRLSSVLGRVRSARCIWSSATQRNFMQWSASGKISLLSTSRSRTLRVRRIFLDLLTILS